MSEICGRYSSNVKENFLLDKHKRVDKIKASFPLTNFLEKDCLLDNKAKVATISKRSKLRLLNDKVCLSAINAINSFSASVLDLSTEQKLGFLFSSSAVRSEFLSFSQFSLTAGWDEAVRENLPKKKFLISYLKLDDLEFLGYAKEIFSFDFKNISVSIIREFIYYIHNIYKLENVDSECVEYFLEYLILQRVEKIKKSLWNTYYCARTIGVGVGEFVKGRRVGVVAMHCKNPFCISCMRAKEMQNVGRLRADLASGYHVVLTVKNCIAGDLGLTINKMLSVFCKIKASFRRRNYSPIGFRKLEITKNNRSNTFHPHFHIWSNDLKFLKYLVKKWLKNFDVLEFCQHIKKCDAGAARELLKYFTKIIYRSHLNERLEIIKGVDLLYMLLALRGRHVLQSFGKNKIFVKEVKDNEFCVGESEDKLLDLIYFDFFDFDGENYRNKEGNLLCPPPVFKRELKELFQRI